LIEKVERRAFGHLVNEIADLLVSGDDSDVKDKLQELASSCDTLTFGELHRKWGEFKADSLG